MKKIIAILVLILITTTFVCYMQKQIDCHSINKHIQTFNIATESIKKTTYNDNLYLTTWLTFEYQSIQYYGLSIRYDKKVQLVAVNVDKPEVQVLQTRFYIKDKEVTHTHMQTIASSDIIKIKPGSTEEKIYCKLIELGKKKSY